MPPNRAPFEPLVAQMEAIAGQRYLVAARKARQVGELPESPQHREWRHAQAEAGRRMEGFRALLYDALEDADPVASAFTPPNSPAWFALGRRLGAAFLSALCDLSCDLEQDTPLNDLIERRRSAIHRFLTVHSMLLDDDKSTGGWLEQATWTDLSTAR